MLKIKISIADLSSMMILLKILKILFIKCDFEFIAILIIKF